MAVSRNVIILLNGAIALVIAGSAALMVRSAVFGEKSATCPERYASAVQWSLSRPNGDLLTTSDLQGQLAGSDWGLIDRARIVRAAGATDDTAMEIDLLAKSRNESTEGAKARSGVGFQWAPQGLDGASALCLSYSVRLADRFELSTGGRLPGLTGGKDRQVADGPSAFSVLPAWTAEGTLEMVGHLPGQSGLQRLSRENLGVTLAPGAWRRVDQELILNTPGKRDGILRLWLDGTLAFERRDMAFRTDEQTLAHAVLGETTLARMPPASMKVGVISITPFELRW